MNYDSIFWTKHLGNGFIWEKGMEQENVKRRLHLSNAPIDCNRVSLNQTPRDVSPGRELLLRMRALGAKFPIVGAARNSICLSKAMQLVAFNAA